MKYRAILKGKFSGPEYNYRVDAESYIASYYKMSLADLDSMKLERVGNQPQKWAISDATGLSIAILGYVVEVA